MKRENFMDACRIAREEIRNEQNVEEMRQAFSAINPKLVESLLGESEVPTCLFEGKYADRMLKRAEFASMEMGWDPDAADFVQSNTTAVRVKRLLR